MKIHRHSKYLYLLLLLIFLAGCIAIPDQRDKDASARLNVVTTTTMITDLVYQICGDSIELKGLMGSGVDPHLYKPTEGDIFRIYNADVIFFNGLHLEGRLDDLFRKMKQRGLNTIAVADALKVENLIEIEGENELYDPHFWLSVKNWKLAAEFVASAVIELDAKNAGFYQENLQNYLRELTDLDFYLREKISQIPPPRRVLITAHDAFGYFGYEFGFEVIGLQGISTVSEAGAADVRNMAELIFSRNIPAIFVESSVSDRNLKALTEAVKSRGVEISIGGTLYSDALGSAGTHEGTYIGMYQHNMQTIWEALK